MRRRRSSSAPTDRPVARWRRRRPGRPSWSGVRTGRARRRSSPAEARRRRQARGGRGRRRLGSGGSGGGPPGETRRGLGDRGGRHPAEDVHHATECDGLGSGAAADAPLAKPSPTLAPTATTAPCAPRGRPPLHQPLAGPPPRTCDPGDDAHGRDQRGQGEPGGHEGAGRGHRRLDRHVDAPRAEVQSQERPRAGRPTRGECDREGRAHQQRTQGRARPTVDLPGVLSSVRMMTSDRVV